MTQKAKLAWVIVVSVLGSLVALATYVDLPSALRNTERSRSQVRISELNYQDVTGDDAQDFIEIENAGTEEVVLTGWCIEGVDFCFEQETRIAGGSVVVVTGAEVTGKFSNSGERVQLKDAVGNVVDEINYTDSSPWPVSANGRGHSLHRLVVETKEVNNTTTTVDGEMLQVGEWIADLPSPGRSYSSDFRRAKNSERKIVIGEIHYHPENDNPDEEFIELVNISTEKMSLNGWCIPEVDVCFTVDDIIEPGTARVISMSNIPTELGNGRGVLRLVDAEKSLHDVVYYEDNGHWPALADGHGSSLHRREAQLSGVEPGNWDARPPSPGVVEISEAGSFLPMFDDVTVTQSPKATQAIVLQARLRDGDVAQLEYKLNFSVDVVVPMQLRKDGVWTAQIPPQPEGTLVRYRLRGTASGTEGMWPRVGDGMVYRGTVVKSAVPTPLPRMQWFVEDDYYAQIYNDSGLFGDDGYPTVVAFDGEVFDGAKIRVRGNQSRLNNKKKWKVVLPAGYETNLGGLLETPVNEFALNSSFTDKSFVREILTSELQKLGGGIGQQVFPLRLEKNNEFYGLYLYQEQPDGRWREKFGFSDATVAFKSDRQATLRLNQLTLPNDEMRQRYQRQTQDWLKHVDEIRELIRQVNNENQQQVLDFAYTSLDVPQIIEALATMRVAQHLEWEHKNHLLLLDPVDGKWRLIPIDFDLNFGRQWVGGCNALCDVVSATAYMEYMEANRLARLFLKIPELRELLDRRTKTLADAFLAEGVVEKRIAELEELLREDAALDRKVWYTFGQKQTMQQAQKILIDNYFVPKRALLTGPASPRLPGPQNATISYTMTGEERVTITNTDQVAIDISGIDVPSLKGKVPAGTVLRPGQSAVFSNDRVPHKGDARVMNIWVPGQ